MNHPKYCSIVENFVKKNQWWIHFHWVSTFDLDPQSYQINKSGHLQQFLAFLVTLCLFSYFLIFNHEKIEKCFQFSFYYLVEKMGHWLKADIYLTFYHIICSFHALVLQTKLVHLQQLPHFVVAAIISLSPTYFIQI